MVAVAGRVVIAAKTFVAAAKVPNFRQRHHHFCCHGMDAMVNVSYIHCWLLVWGGWKVYIRLISFNIILNLVNDTGILVYLRMGKWKCHFQGCHKTKDTIGTKLFDSVCPYIYNWLSVERNHILSQNLVKMDHIPKRIVTKYSGCWPFVAGWTGVYIHYQENYPSGGGLSQIAMVDVPYGLTPPPLIWMVLVIGCVAHDPINVRC